MSVKSRHPAGPVARAHLGAGQEAPGHLPAEAQSMNGHNLNGHRPPGHPPEMQAIPARRATNSHAYHRQSSKAVERRALDDMDE